MIVSSFLDRSPAQPGTCRAWMLAAVDLVFPALCPVCQAQLAAGRRDPLCGSCWARVERITPPGCEVCGLPLARCDPLDHPADARRCGGCMQATPGFAYARAAAWYRGPVREAIHAFKFRGKRALANPLADLVLEQVRGTLDADVAALVPVPLARERERERGFNQASLLAERLGPALGVRSRPRWLVRTRATRAQTDLGADARRANVRDAFTASAEAAGLHVVVVDDVFTTGATVGECARALYAAGAARVGVLTVARVVAGAVY